MALIALDHVSKVYPKGTRPALDDVNLDIERGDFVFLVGASGSGKTTLLSLLLREEEATDGEIRVAGNDLRRLTNRQVPQYRRSIGFVFQDYKLLVNKTVWQNVAFALEVIGTRRSAIKSLVPQVLQTVGLTGKENNYPHELSGGEQQRVAIARAYVNHPQILLADEPTGNLDPTTSLGIMEVLDAINRTGTTIVMATHNEEIVATRPRARMIPPSSSPTAMSRPRRMRRSAGSRMIRVSALIPARSTHRSPLSRPVARRVQSRVSKWSPRRSAAISGTKASPGWRALCIRGVPAATVRRSSRWRTR